MNGIISLSSLIYAGENIIRVPGARLGYHRLRIGVPPGTLITVQYERVIEGVRYDARLRTDGIASGVYEFSIDGDLSFLVVASSADVSANIWIESTEQAAGAFTGDRAMVTQPYDAINIKRGLQFELPVLFDPITQGASKFVLAEVGEKDIIIKTREIDTNGGMEYRPWVGATYTKGALIDAVVNLNNKSATENTTKFYEVSGVSLVGASSFDIVKSPVNTGSNRTLGQFPTGIERVVSAGSVILLEFKNTQSQDIWLTFKTTWYEGPQDVLPDEPKP